MKYGVLCYTKDAETLHCIMFVLACPYSSSFLSQDMAYGEVKKKKIQKWLILSKPLVKNNRDKSKFNLLAI